MTKILLSGCLGRMGRAVTEAASAHPDRFTIIGGIDIGASTGAVLPFPVYTSLSEIPESAERPDVIIDFSHHAALPSLLEYGTRHRLPLVIATTGHTEEEQAAMRKAAQTTAIFFYETSVAQKARCGFTK